MQKKLMQGQIQEEDGYEVPEKRTENKEESLAPSLLSHIKDGQLKEKDLEELLGVVQKQDQDPMLQVASQDPQAKVPAVEEDEEAAKDLKR